MNNFYFFALLIFLISSCGEIQSLEEKTIPDPLPFLGDMGIDHVVPKFKFLDQDSIWKTNDDFKDRVWITEFFFSTCPSICPIMNKQMKRLQKELTSWEKQTQLISFSINPSYDSPSILKAHIANNNFNTKNWVFLTGVPENQVHELGVKSFLVHAGKDEDDVSGYAHSGAFTLVDKTGHVRGVYQITDPNGDADEKEYQRLKLDLENLLTYEYGLIPGKN